MRRAASVRPEPGSNSPTSVFRPRRLPRGGQAESESCLVFSADVPRRGLPAGKFRSRPPVGNTGRLEYIPRAAAPARQAPGGAGRRADRRNDIHSAFDTLFSCQGARGRNCGGRCRRSADSPVDPKGPERASEQLAD